MGAPTVLHDVSETLLALLREYMPKHLIPHEEQIALVSPADKGNARLGLYLYNVRETGFNRHNEPTARGSVPGQSLYLSYLVTGYSTAELALRVFDEQQLLGYAMQIFYDNAIVRPPYLKGTLLDNDEEVRIKYDNLSADMMQRIWQFPNVPYRLSIGLEVGPVEIESGRGQLAPRVGGRSDV